MTVIISEVGGTGAGILRGTAPNTTNTPGNLWTSGSDLASAIRNNSRIEANNSQDRNAVDAEVTDMKVSATFDPNGGTAGGDECWLFARCDAGVAAGGGNGFGVKVSPNRVVTAALINFTSGSGSNIDSDTTALLDTAGQTIAVEITVNGTAISAVITQGATVINLSAVDANHSTLTQCGLMIGGTTAFLDDFSVDDLDAGGGGRGGLKLAGRGGMGGLSLAGGMAG